MVAGHAVDLALWRELQFEKNGLGSCDQLVWQAQSEEERRIERCEEERTLEAIEVIEEAR